MKPTVTQIIGLLDKPALLNWANKQGLKGIDISLERKKWLNDGTSNHSQIENYLKNKTPFLNSENQQRFEQFISNYEVLEIEKKVECEWFVGRFDIKLRDKRGIYICDFKNNQSNIYFENKLQFTAYKMCENSDYIAIISTMDFNFIPIYIQDYKPYETILKCLSKIYQLKQEF
jgi:hypothetical protein